MTTFIELHESILGDFASRDDAKTLGLALIDKGWPVMYCDNGSPHWRFDSLADYRRFGREWEDTVDELSGAGVLRITWDCDCDERQDEPCPHGEDPRKTDKLSAERPLADLWGYELRRAIERRYPGLGDWIQANVDCLYGALSFALQLEEKDVTSASGLWLRRKWPERHGGGLVTYDKAVQDFAEFTHAASEDAWFSEYLAKNRLTLEELTTCEACHGLQGVDCRCGGGQDA